MISQLRQRLAREESGFTLIELLVVIIIIGILLAIAIPSYLSFKERANERAAQANVRAAIPAIEAYNADNVGTATDVDSSATTTGYAGMTTVLLTSTYDQGIKGIALGTVSSTGYCVQSSVGQSTYSKTVTATSNGDIVKGACGTT